MMSFKSPISPLVLLSLLGCACLVVRWQAMGLSVNQYSSLEQLPKLKSTTTFGFLIWNLFLAWLPLLFALLLERSIKNGNRLLISIGLLLAWLVFLPNAPYIFTDLLHLKWRHPIPHWFDLMIFVIFAWTGWQLGIYSLLKVNSSLKQVISATWSNSIVVLAVILCAPGVYLGRILRYNSWDLLHRPGEIIQDLVTAMVFPFQTPGAGMIWLLVPFLLLTFWSHRVMGNFSQNERIRKT